MMNTSFSVSKKIYLDEAFAAITTYFSNNESINVFYDKDRHPGIKFIMKHDGRDMCGLLFKSGSVILTGLKTDDEFLTGATTILECLHGLAGQVVLQNNLETFELTKTKKRATKRQRLLSASIATVATVATVANDRDIFDDIADYL